MKVDRIHCCQDSNNPDNPNKNLCVLEVAQFLGVDNEAKYLHYPMDIVLAARKSGKLITSHLTYKVGRFNTVGGIRKKLSEIAEKQKNSIGFLLYLEEHVILLDSNGKTIVDTDPRIKDRRAILGIWQFFSK